jgi:hypothetical protein
MAYSGSLYISLPDWLSSKVGIEMKEIETYAVYQRQALLSRDALEATLSPYK